MKIIILSAIVYVVVQNGMNIHAGDEESTAKQCPSFCTYEYAPVCGYDENADPKYKTFPTRCVLNSINCQNGTNYIVIYNGTCKDRTEKPCNTICTKNYDPVCGKYGNDTKTFSNPCMMNLYNCENKTNYTQVCAGRCRNDVISETYCPQICNTLYSPVCACNFSTCKNFSNYCFFAGQTCNQIWCYRGNRSCTADEVPDKNY